MTEQARLDVENKSNVWKFLWIGFYSALLALPTLTLFRFWERTIVRRQLWSDTTIGGEPLEYTGKGSELFIGFLIACFTVVLPLTLAILAIQFLLGPGAVVVAIFFLYFLLFVLLGVAIYVARRYQLSRTNWRGVRFELRGSPWSYGFATLGYLILTFLTLGWFGPAMTLRLEKRLWENTYFGDMPFAYDNSSGARTEPVYVSYILAFIGVLVFYAITIAAMFAIGYFEDPTGIGLEQIAILYAAIFGGALVLTFFVAWHQAALIRQITKSISFGAVQLRSKLSAGDVIWLALSNALLIVGTLGFGIVAAQMRVWRRICRRLEIEGALDLAQIEQAASRGPGSGEGMADAFDISGGV